jgi:hypothetical protein
MIRNFSHNFRKTLILAGGLTALLFLWMIGSAFLILSRWPKIGALGADQLRSIVGGQNVANMETIALQSYDLLHQWEHQITKSPPTPPWEIPTSVSGQTSVPGSNPAQSASIGAPTPPQVPSVNQAVEQPPSPPLGSIPGKESNTAQSASIDAPKPPQAPVVYQAWQLPAIPAMGSIPGEGHWQPYLYDPAGQIVAERVFLQPDPARPYAVVAIVAFDLQNTRLHFVVGSVEPKSTVAIPRSGKIPAGDMQPGMLLAAFNGGFRAQDGNFGVMTNGVILIPPRDGLGTVGLYSDGRVQIGDWGTDMQLTPDLVVFRQNGPLMIHDGVISSNIADNNPQEWGYTVGGKIATYRSALGISRDGRTLYYAAGGGLTRPELAQALLAAGAYQALQMDINDYWVHFDAFQLTGRKLTAAPLLDEMKQQDDQRYLQGFIRDFFYVTATSSSTTGK